MSLKFGNLLVGNLKLYLDELDSLQIKFQTPFQKEFENDATNSISITNSGMKKYSISEINSIKTNFQAENNSQLENDSTNSVTFSNQGANLFTLKAVIKLGMLMHNVESAKLFRDSIIEELQAGVTFKKAYQSTTQASLMKNYQKMIFFSKIL